MVGTTSNGIPHYICGSYLRDATALMPRSGRRRRNSHRKAVLPYRNVKHDEAEAWLRDYFGDVLPHVQKITTSIRAEKPEAIKTALVNAMTAWSQMIAA
jgi:hypothetical protein